MKRLAMEVTRRTFAGEITESMSPVSKTIVVTGAQRTGPDRS